MSENCNQQCNDCIEECSERKDANNFLEKPHKMSNINKVIGVVSGKGGVGKSLITSLMSVAMNRKGYKVGILDADITGPSIPKVFGIKEKAKANSHGMLPVNSKTGIDIMSINLLLEKDTDPVVWRGPVIGGVVKQFWTDVIWKDIDYMFIDMPPGTGDVPLTVFQSIKMDGIIIVTSPQELVSMIVGKAVKMAKMMNIPIIGIVENMSYINCPDCNKRMDIFGRSNIEEISKEYDIELFAKIPIDVNIARLCDKGEIEDIDFNWLDIIVDAIE